ncbi:MAG: hypothetical protein U0R69_03205 [Gaiellales bacterium]
MDGTRRGRVTIDEDVRVRDIAGEERAALGRDLGGDPERLPVQPLEDVLLADHAQLLAVCVVGQRLDDVRPRVHELAVELADDLGVVEHDLGDERARLEVPAPLELPDIALGTDDRPACEPLEETARLRRGRHRQIPRPSQ